MRRSGSCGGGRAALYAIACVAAVASPRLARAQTIPVTSTDLQAVVVDGACSLHEAMRRILYGEATTECRVDPTSEPDAPPTIVLPEGDFVVRSPIGYAGPMCAPIVLPGVFRPLRIRGAGARLTRLLRDDASPPARLFHVSIHDLGATYQPGLPATCGAASVPPDPPPEPRLELEDLSIVGMDARGTDPTRGALAFKGAALFVGPSAVVEVRRVAFIGNRAGSGGAILVGNFDVDRPTEVLTIYDSWFSENQAEVLGGQGIVNGLGGRGGAIRIESGAVHVINTSFYRNFAAEHGGAISSSTVDEASVLQSSFVENVVRGDVPADPARIGGGGALAMGDVPIDPSRDDVEHSRVRLAGAVLVGNRSAGVVSDALGVTTAEHTTFETSMGWEGSSFETSVILGYAAPALKVEAPADALTPSLFLGCGQGVLDVGGLPPGECPSHDGWGRPRGDLAAGTGVRCDRGALEAERVQLSARLSGEREQRGRVGEDVVLGVSFVSEDRLFQLARFRLRAHPSVALSVEVEGAGGYQQVRCARVGEEVECNAPGSRAVRGVNVRAHARPGLLGRYPITIEPVGALCAVRDAARADWILEVVAPTRHDVSGGGACVVGAPRGAAAASKPLAATCVLLVLATAGLCVRRARRR